MVVSGEAPSTRRSRLGPEREGELFDAVLELLREVGYEGMSMPAVAARARCSTATLYRQWQGKPGLVVAALRHHQPGPLSGIDTGTLRGDLRALILGMPAAGAEEHELFAALEHAGLRDPELAAAMRDTLTGPTREVLRQMLSRGVDRGEISASSPARNYIQDLILGIGLSRRLNEGVAPSQDYLLDFVDAVLLPALRSSENPVA